MGAALAVVGAPVTSAPAFAAPPEAEVVAVSYATSEQCPTREAFLAGVRRYTTRWRALDADESARVRRFRIAFEPSGAAKRGTLVVENASGQATRREIVANDCERVARGLAIAMALALDPAAEIATPAPPKETDTSPTLPLVEQPAPVSKSLPDEAVVPVAVPLDAPPPSSPVSPPTRSLRFGVEAKVELASAITNRPVPVLGAAFEIHTAPPRMPKWLAPSFGVGLRQSLPASVEASAASAEFSWTAAQLRACPLRFDLLASRLEVMPCAEANIGVLRAEARRALDARQSTSSWFDLGGSVRALYRVSPSWGIGVSGLVTAPFVRHRFALDDQTLLSQPPAVAIAGGLLAEFVL
ncbi:hypothetical protein AKJ09_10645 [Labilithrix luteola]|uniref:Uncharacterized protein n=1 Tax=Labilithrix luteola TaxID=1391654 RepID=A0A0K1QE87_9BACT|nr:hypothetical protein [Labilithrix luteola]AKV03982.1 hypothetical protein AKJ09_10645 [Labilithrix luteola]